MAIKRITAWMDFDDGEGCTTVETKEEAIQSLLESLADDCAVLSFEEE